MFVTCHINFWPLSNFVGASLEVTRTISNNKLYFTWGCSRPEGPETGFFFSNDSDIFLSILILIITSLAIHYSQNVFRGLSIQVCIGVQVFIFMAFFYFLLLFSHVTRSRAFLALASVWPKNCACSADPDLLNETEGSWLPLSSLSSYQNGW